VAGLLKAMVRARVVDLARHWQAKKRDLRKNADLSDPGIAAASRRDQTPSQLVADAEILSEFAKRLNDEERSILKLRQEGRSWHDLAAAMGGERSPEALRKRHERSIARVSRELGFSEE